MRRAAGREDDRTRYLFSHAPLLFPLILSLIISASRSDDRGPNPISPRRVRLGNEVLFDSFPEELHGRRLGLVINQTSVLPAGPTLQEKLLAEGHRVAAIFTPEHGLRGHIEGGREIDDGRWHDIRIFSLYGKQVRPTPEQLRHVDALIYDLQDIGTRFYTYITTLKYILEAAAEADLPVYILDRPNPLGGRIIEGPILKKGLESFISALPVPTRYGLTCGELGLMMAGEGWVPRDVRVRVIKTAHWKRGQTWKGTGLPWIPTSPNIPNPESALCYPGTGLFGGIKINQGLGTPHPFLLLGAPWLDPEELLRRLPGDEEIRARLEPVLYTPEALPGKVLEPPYKNRPCRGLRIRILDEENFFSLRFALEIIQALKELYPDRISVSSPALDRMFGDRTLSRFIEGKLGFDELVRLMKEDEERFREKRKRYLLYDDLP